MNKKGKVKEETIKNQLLKYIFPIYLSIIVLALICYLSSFKVDTSGNFGGFALLGHYAIWIILIVVVSSILSFILAFKNIKNNYNESDKSNIKKVIINIFNSILVYNIVSIIISKVILIIYGSFISYFYGLLFEPVYYILLTPLIIPIVKYFNKDNYVSRNHARLLLVFFILLSGLLCILRINNSTRFYTNITFLFPYTIIGLQNKSNKSQEINNKDIIISIALIVIYFTIIFV